MVEESNPNIEKTEDGKYILKGLFTEFANYKHNGRIYPEIPDVKDNKRVESSKLEDKDKEK